MKSIIEVKNIGKKYNIAHQRGGYVALRDVIANIFRNPFAFVADKAKSAVGLKVKEEFWALKDISFTVNKGEVVGVIGANGAGKSTLLKILSQITPPTEGEVILRGRVGSLLEVGTGFHPELTGRENIFLNGAILGMKKKEIVQKFDEIVAFAGIEKFLDTPVKHYSSGMHVRLAFSVAAHMEPEILVVDEVLAVGDAEFQKKCLGKMDEITKRDGRTILFVSHNIAAVMSLCTRTILLDHGKIVDAGDTDKVIDTYKKIISARNKNLTDISLKNRLKRTTGDVLFEIAKGIRNNKESWDFGANEDILLEFKAIAQKDIDNLLFYMSIKDSVSGEIVSNIKTVISDKPIRSGKSIAFSISVPKKVLRPGHYSLYFTLSDIESKIFFDVIDDNVNIPLLNIITTSLDEHENIGFFSMPYTLKVND